MTKLKEIEQELKEFVGEKFNPHHGAGGRFSSAGGGGGGGGAGAVAKPGGSPVVARPLGTGQHLKGDAEITKFIQSRRPGATVKIESARNVLGEANSKIARYETSKVKGHMTFMRDINGNFFNHRGGGRYGPPKQYNNEVLK